MARLRHAEAIGAAALFVGVLSSACSGGVDLAEGSQVHGGADGGQDGGAADSDSSAPSPEEGVPSPGDAQGEPRADAGDGDSTTDVRQDAAHVDADSDGAEPGSGRYVVLNPRYPGIATRHYSEFTVLDIDTMRVHSFDVDHEQGVDTAHPVFSWSPDGRSLVYAPGLAIQLGDPYLLRFTDSGFSSVGPMQGFAGKTGSFSAPSWSADSRFVGMLRKGGADSSIDFIDVVNAERVGSFGAMPVAGWIDFAPAGFHFKYSLFFEDTWREESGYATLTATGVVDLNVLSPGTWSMFSRDGRTLAFETGDPPDHATLRRVMPPGLPEGIPIDVPDHLWDLRAVSPTGTTFLASVGARDPLANRRLRQLYVDPPKPSAPVGDPKRITQDIAISDDGTLGVLSYADPAGKALEMIDLTTLSRVPIGVVRDSASAQFWGHHVVYEFRTEAGADEVHTAMVSSGRIVDSVVSDAPELGFSCVKDRENPTRAGLPVRAVEAIPDKFIYKTADNLALVSLAEPKGARVGTLKPSEPLGVLSCPVWTRKGDAFVYTEDLEAKAKVFLVTWPTGGVPSTPRLIHESDRPVTVRAFVWR